MSSIDKHTASRYWLEIVQIIVLIECSLKFLQLIQYNESFGYLVEMLTQVSKDIYPFLVIFFTFTGIFVIVTDIIEGGYPSDDYQFMANFHLIINMLQSFRNSIGDLAEPLYGKWIQVKNEPGVTLDIYQYGIMIVTWTFFIANIFIMQIVLLNFLIAEVS